MDAFEIGTKALRSPCVYQFKRGSRTLYVGYSRLGVLRPFSPNHHKRLIRDVSDTIEVQLFEAECDAAEYEEELIKQLNPPCNDEPRPNEIKQYVWLIEKVGTHPAGNWVPTNWFRFRLNGYKEDRAVGVEKTFCAEMGLPVFQPSEGPLR